MKYYTSALKKLIKEMKILINEKEENDIMTFYSIKGQIATDVEEMGKVKKL